MEVIDGLFSSSSHPPSIQCEKAMQTAILSGRSFLSRPNIHHLSCLGARFMASKSAISSLSSPLRDLVAAAAPRDEDWGVSEKDRAEVGSWISKVAEGEIVKPSSADELNKTLLPKTYIVSNYLTAADVALYGALHPTYVS